METKPLIELIEKLKEEAMEYKILSESSSIKACELSMELYKALLNTKIQFDSREKSICAFLLETICEMRNQLSELFSVGILGEEYDKCKSVKDSLDKFYEGLVYILPSGIDYAIKELQED